MASSPFLETFTDAQGQVWVLADSLPCSNFVKNTASTSTSAQPVGGTGAGFNNVQPFGLDNAHRDRTKQSSVHAGAPTEGHTDTRVKDTGIKGTKTTDGNTSTTQMPASNNPTTCETCGQMFMSKTGLYNHLRIARHWMPGTGVGRFGTGPIEPAGHHGGPHNHNSNQPRGRSKSRSRSRTKVQPQSRVPTATTSTHNTDNTGVKKSTASQTFAKKGVDDTKSSTRTGAALNRSRCSSRSSGWGTGSDSSKNDSLTTPTTPATNGTALQGGASRTRPGLEGSGNGNSAPNAGSGTLNRKMRRPRMIALAEAKFVGETFYPGSSQSSLRLQIRIGVTGAGTLHLYFPYEFGKARISAPMSQCKIHFVTHTTTGSSAPLSTGAFALEVTFPLNVLQCCTADPEPAAAYTNDPELWRWLREEAEVCGSRDAVVVTARAAAEDEIARQRLADYFVNDINIGLLTSG